MQRSTRCRGYQIDKPSTAIPEMYGRKASNVPEDATQTSRKIRLKALEAVSYERAVKTPLHHLKEICILEGKRKADHPVN